MEAEVREERKRYTTISEDREGDQEPRNAGGPWSLDQARKPLSPQKPCSPAEALVLEQLT